MQVLIGATDHKEAFIIRVLKEGTHAIDFLNYPFIRLLVDIYHMNTEKPSLLDPLSEYMNYYPHPYISDGNRAYPSLGSLDFVAIYRKLVESGYRGTMAVERNIQHGLLEDTQVCAACLYKICGGLYTPSHVSYHVV